MKSSQIIFILLITNFSLSKYFMRERSNLFQLSRHNKENLQTQLLREKEIERKLNKNINQKARTLVSNIPETKVDNSKDINIDLSKNPQAKKTLSKGLSEEKEEIEVDSNEEGLSKVDVIPYVDLGLNIYKFEDSKIVEQNKKINNEMKKEESEKIINTNDIPLEKEEKMNLDLPSDSKDPENKNPKENLEEEFENQKNAIKDKSHDLVENPNAESIKFTSIITTALSAFIFIAL